ncbi:MAG TPA: hypothetical protein DCX27_20055, partial [Balneola sp.]|nr:hypothetical protein [Balneola sp.]
MIRLCLIATLSVLIANSAFAQQTSVDTLYTGLKKATSFTFGNDAIYIVEAGAHRVLKLGMDGKLIERYGKRGSGNYQFDNPVDIATTNGLKLFVSDKGNNRIQVFDKRWQYLSFISGNDRFQTRSEIRPAFLGVNKLGDVYFYDERSRTLGKYNEDYGEQLYMIVERPAKEYSGATFAYPDDIESTDDILDKLRSDEENIVDEQAYIRARMFDMLVGDWDRHNDQWRWAEYKNQNGKDVFIPIPRDRDQAITNFDGAILDIARTLFGMARQFQVYDENLDDMKWFNNAGIKLDRALAQRSGRAVWHDEAQFIKEHITDEIIEEAFERTGVRGTRT